MGGAGVLTSHLSSQSNRRTLTILSLSSDSANLSSSSQSSRSSSGLLKRVCFPDLKNAIDDLFTEFQAILSSELPCGIISFDAQGAVIERGHGGYASVRIHLFLSNKGPKL